MRAAIQEHRFLLLHRPENLISEEHEQIDSLFANPIGEQLQVPKGPTEGPLAHRPKCQLWGGCFGRKRSQLHPQDGRRAPLLRDPPTWLRKLRGQRVTISHHAAHEQPKGDKADQPHGKDHDHIDQSEWRSGQEWL